MSESQGDLQAFYFGDFVSHGTAVQPRVWTQSSMDVKSRWVPPSSPRGSPPWVLLFLWSLAPVPWLLCLSFSLTLSLYILISSAPLLMCQSQMLNPHEGLQALPPPILDGQVHSPFPPHPIFLIRFTLAWMITYQTLLFTSLLCLLLISLPTPPTVTPANRSSLVLGIFVSCLLAYVKQPRTPLSTHCSHLDRICWCNGHVCFLCCIGTPLRQGPCFAGLCQSTIQHSFWYNWKGIAECCWNNSLISLLKVTVIGKTFCFQTAVTLGGGIIVSTMYVSASMRTTLVSWEISEG